MFRLIRAFVFSTGLLFVLCGCVSNTVFVPVVEAGKAPVEHEIYTVQPGDTLYSIAWAFDLDFRKLIEINHLEKPYHVSVGQTLRLVSSAISTPIGSKAVSRSSGGEKVKFTATSKLGSAKHVQQMHWRTEKIGSWIIPARGRTVNIFSSKYGASGKGLEIHGHFGEPIKAAASGTVVYSGDGLRSYGNLLLIKHNDAYLSAYAFNQKLLVKAGAQVKQGQEIATMGKDGRGMPILYFEIRRFGKPVNPALYLKK